VYIPTHLVPGKKIVRALANLVDLLVLPPREESLNLITEVRTTLLDPRKDRSDIAKALVHLIENSREVALVPAVIADLVRHSPSTYPKDLINMKLWKRWAPVIQGTLSIPKEPILAKKDATKVENFSLDSSTKKDDNS
jgi:hypothetical protein